MLGKFIAGDFIASRWNENTATTCPAGYYGQKVNLGPCIMKSKLDTFILNFKLILKASLIIPRWSQKTLFGIFTK
jgi:hypothetical protein